MQRCRCNRGFRFLAKFRGHSKRRWIQLSKSAEQIEYNVFNFDNNENDVEVEPHYRSAVTELFKNYKLSDAEPQCPEKLSIILISSNIAFHESPSRLSAQQREVV